MITTEAMVAELPKDEAPMPDMGCGMGSMCGMMYASLGKAVSGSEFLL